MKQRQAQAVLLYGMDLEEHFGEFPVERASESWLSDEQWQPARRYVERCARRPTGASAWLRPTSASRPPSGS